MRPDELLAELQRRMDRAPDAVRQAQAAAMSEIVKVKVTGHQVSGKGNRVRVQGRYSRSVARRMVQRARAAAELAMRKAMT